MPIPTCSNGATYNYDLKKCECPLNKPHDDGFKCIACYLPKYWDTEEKACLECPDKLHYNSTLKKCISCPDGYYYDESQDICTIDKSCSIDGQVFDDKLNRCVCASTTPFFDGEKCMSCYLPKYWNFSERRCMECPEDQYFDPVQS